MQDRKPPDARHQLHNIWKMDYANLEADAAGTEQWGRVHGTVHTCLCVVLKMLHIANCCIDQTLTRSLPRWDVVELNY